LSKSKFSNKKKLGVNIFIHGSFLATGCIPIEDRAIEEVYELVENSLIMEFR